MIRVGIAGMGFMGMIHYLTYRKLSGTRVVAICDPKPARLAGDWRDIRGNFGPPGQHMDLSGVRTYTEIEELLADDEVELADLTLPPALHADITCRALSRGKHVFCEKPLALNSSDCQRMLAAAREAHRRLLVGHVLPYFPEYAWALQAVRDGKHGRLRGGSFKRVIADPTWLTNYWHADQIGGPMLDLHVHDAHFIRLLFGMPSEVLSRGTMSHNLPKAWESQFKFDSDEFVVDATCGIVGPEGPEFNHGFTIQLEQATLKFEFAVLKGQGRYLCPLTLIDLQGNETPVELSSADPMDAFKGELREMLSCIAENRDGDVLEGELASDAIRLCYAQIESLTTGCSAQVR